MVDFKKMLAGKAKPLPKHPREIFNSLPRPPGINELYVSQAEVLDAWFQRREEQDLVVKLHTGGGKTLVALLMGQSTLNEFSDPVLYLAPTKQLVDQVLAMSRLYGIPAVAYQKGQPLAGEFLDGKAVMVGAYECLFSGRSKFGVRGSGKQPVKLGAIILDDAHVALSSVRDAFSLKITSKDHLEVYKHIADMFRGSFFEVGRSGAFADITRNKDYGVLEVPAWAWQKRLQEVQEYLSHVVDDVDEFVWPFLRDNLAVCHCLISGRAINITPIFPTVDMLPSFEDAKRRIFMSATIADDSDIVRTFGASTTSVSAPVTSVSLAGVGERMILVPELMELGETPIIPMVKAMATEVAKKAGVVVLAPSGQVARTWTDIASYPDTTQAVSAKVEALRALKERGPVVLANRYDGIDLAGDACRFLVVDGLPMGTSDYELYRADVMSDSAVNNYLAQRIEQGIGRGTRGGSDFCVVVLTGSKLVSWVGRKSSLPFLTAATRIQLEVGQDVSAAVKSPKELLETAVKCLDRDPDWVTYHASELSAAARDQIVDQAALELVAVERRAFRQQRLGQFQPALNTLETALGRTEIAINDEVRGWLNALAARIFAQMGDEGGEQKHQTSAYSYNNNHTPPRVRPIYVPRPKPGPQASKVVSRLVGFQRRGAMLAEFNTAVSALVPDASANQYEEALKSLGDFLGFAGERPEKTHKVGPDVLWRTAGDFDFVIEAKSEKQDQNALYKTDHAQLLEAEQWFNNAYPSRKCVRVSALAVPRADRKATTAGTLALTLSNAGRLASSVRELISVISQQEGPRDQLEERCQAELVRLKLTPAQLRDEYMVPFS